MQISAFIYIHIYYFLKTENQILRSNIKSLSYFFPQLLFTLGVHMVLKVSISCFPQGCGCTMTESSGLKYGQTDTFFHRLLPNPGVSIILPWYAKTLEDHLLNNFLTVKHNFHLKLDLWRLCLNKGFLFKILCTSWGLQLSLGLAHE